MPPRLPQPRPASTALLLWGTLFGLAYAQEPLFTSNQNQYFLHGLAQAGAGLLRQDWLANTLDPTPVFSWLVRLTATLDIRLFYLYAILVFALYFASLMGIVRSLPGGELSWRGQLILMAILFLTHSAAVRTLLAWTLGGEWAYLFDGGVAGQRLLGSVIQPSSFGALLLVGIHQFLERRPFRAATACAAAAIVHPTYLLSAGTLTLAMLGLLYREEGGPRRPLQVGAWALLLVAPILYYSARTFLPGSPEAARILIHFRLPAHAVPAEWLDATVGVKITLILLALAAARRSRLFPLLWISGAVALGLTLIQALTGSDALALLFPWRLSTVLVPLSVAVLAARGGQATDSRLADAGPGPRRAATGLALGTMAVAVIAGLLWSATQFAQRRADPARGAFEYIASHLHPGDLYLIPPKLQDFRLATGAPALADFKSIPYRAGEVIEWHERVRLAQWFFREDMGAIDCGLLELAVGEYGITHVLLGPEQQGLSCERWTSIYGDGQYAVLAYSPSSP